MINGTIVAIIGAVAICLIIIIAITIFISQTRYNNNNNISLLEGSLGQSCYYNGCASVLSCDTTSFTCKNDVTGACIQGSDCFSGFCVSGFCSSTRPDPNPDPDEPRSPCVNGQCQGDLVCNTLGSDNQNWCLFSNDEICEVNLDCNSFNCTNGVCVSGTPNGYPCAQDPDCQSNFCSSNICQPEGITTGIAGSYCVTDTYGNGFDYVESNCNSGLSCTGNLNDPEVAGTCVALTNFMLPCTTAADCSSQFDCTPSYAQGTGTYCLLHYDDPMDVDLGKTCVVPFVPKSSTDITSCLGITNSPCYNNSNCGSNVCGTNVFSTSIFHASQIVTPNLSALKGAFPLGLTTNVLSGSNIFSYDIINYPYGSTEAYIMSGVFSENTISNLQLQNIIGSSNIGYGFTENFYDFQLVLLFGTTYQNYLLCLCEITPDGGNVIIQLTLEDQDQIDIGLTMPFNFPITQDGSYTQLHIDTTGTTTNYIITKPGSILTGQLTINTNNGALYISSYGSQTSVNSTGYIDSGPKAISVFNGVTYVFYSILNGVRIINLTTNTPLSFSFNSTEYPFRIYDFSPYIMDGVLGVYTVLETMEQNVSFTSLLDLYDTTQNTDAINTWNLPGNTTTNTQVFVVDDTLAYLPTNICS